MRLLTYIKTLKKYENLGMTDNNLDWDFLKLI